MNPRRKRILLVGALALESLAVWLRGYPPYGGRVAVRCRKGHLFTTLWIPGVSLKSLRIGFWRIQRCPVGKHWSLVTPVAQSDLSAADQQAAAGRADIPIP